MKNSLFIFFLFVACTNHNNDAKEIGNLSILEYPDIKELNRWIESDSQYANVYQVRRYFENFVNDEFFEEEENQTRFNDITWLYMSEYQKKYTELLNKYEKNFKEYKELTSFVDSLIIIEYPIINEFTNEIFRLGYN
jgi:predicted AlkP superfamily phosphohydrolase/phosphomutase